MAAIAFAAAAPEQLFNPPGAKHIVKETLVILEREV